MKNWDKAIEKMDIRKESKVKLKKLIYLMQNNREFIVDKDEEYEIYIKFEEIVSNIKVPFLYTSNRLTGECVSKELLDLRQYYSM